MTRNIKKKKICKKEKVKSKGFTLIELLAVITIMGILMMAAIPAITKTIESSRRDTFANTVKSYVNSARNMWSTDQLSCDGKTSGDADEFVYYVKVDTSDPSTVQLLEQGGKSSWGNRDMKGYILVYYTHHKLMFIPFISDGEHGFNINSSGDVNFMVDMYGNLSGDCVDDQSITGKKVTLHGATYLDSSLFGSFKECVER